MHKRKICTTILLITLLFLLSACTFLEQSETIDNNETSNKIEDESVPVEAEKEEGFTLPDAPLQKGDQGEDVHFLQERLIELGYPIKATKVFDENTTWAITDLQLQSTDIFVTGMYNTETKKALETAFDQETEFKVAKALPKPKNNEQDTSTKVIENPYDVLAVINKEYALPGDYIPEDLVVPNVRFPFTEDLPKKQLRKMAARALEEMFKQADENGLDLYAQSGYRSYDRQEAIFAANVEQHGEESANNFSARPGESEHQSGLTMDVTSPDVNFDLTIPFGKTAEGKWIKEHASDYGFIIRYLEGKEDITGYQYEPWHLRYVGKKAAKEIMEKNLTLEEYIEGKL